MGREVRRVPANWKHPTANTVDGYVPLFGGSFAEAAREWDEDKVQWDCGFTRSYSSNGDRYEPKKERHDYAYEEYAGERPDPKDYMPDWPEAERTHYQMYETCTEGTPLSPPMKTPEELARYLADTGASSFGSMTATYDQWLKMIHAQWAPSAVFSAGTGLISGVEGFSP